MKLQRLAAAALFGLVALPAAAEQNAHQHQDHQQNQTSACTVPMGEGTIHTLDIQAATATIAHAPIESLGWPEMTMAFKVSKGVDLSPFVAGDRVHFLLAARGDSHEVAALCGLDAPEGMHKACMTQMDKIAQKQASADGTTCPMDHGGTHGDKPDTPAADHSGHSGH